MDFDRVGLGGTTALAASPGIEAGTLAEIVMFPAMLAVAAFVIWVLVTEWYRRRRLELILDLRMRLFERLISSDIARAAQADCARLLVSLAQVRGVEESGDRVIRVGQIGIVLLSLAAGLFLLAAINSLGAQHQFLALAIVAGFVGLGFVLSAAMAWRLTARAPDRAGIDDGADTG